MSNFTKLKVELEGIINSDEDSVIIYTFRSLKYSDRIEMGLKKGGDDFII